MGKRNKIIRKLIIRVKKELFYSKEIEYKKPF